MPLLLEEGEDFYLKPKLLSWGAAVLAERKYIYFRSSSMYRPQFTACECRLSVAHGPRPNAGHRELTAAPYGAINVRGIHHSY